jgi:hypothetical protein
MKWLAAALCAMAMWGCLLPQDDHYLDLIPDSRNKPPRILESLVFPDRMVITNNGADCSVVFSARVEDPDVGDPITVRWYVDYDPSSNPSYYRESRLANNGKPIRDESATLTMNIDSLGNPLQVVGDHLVELLVADGTLLNRDPQPRDEPTDGGAPQNLTYAVTYAWFVSVEAGTCP